MKGVCQSDHIGYDPSTDEVYIEYDRGKDSSLPVVIARGVAAITGKQVEEIPSLYSVVDPDALDSLFGPSSEENDRTLGKVSFEYYNFEITVYASDVVCIDISNADIELDHPRS
ncbi:HalOD1 output domain-containing protein [Natrarchaeobius halalkaliphilus]|uniref:HalOD1 output domain-containing protein n=1 Tax=Natrarchaeobius halalkaliphilus TaxID=1679091 RepID=UPI000F52DD66|nr:HalOD1 output domain-containing protein [Natrarchaeobius halalkaliphilus]